MFGRKTKKQTKSGANKTGPRKSTGPANKPAAKAAAKPASGGQSDEAKAILAKMQAKKDAGDCPFC